MPRRVTRRNGAGTDCCAALECHPSDKVITGSGPRAGRREIAGLTDGAGRLALAMPGDYTIDRHG